MADRPNDPETRASSDEQRNREQIIRDLRDQTTVISGRAQLLRRHIRRGTLDVTDVDRSLQRIEEAARRVAALLKRLEQQP